MQKEELEGVVVQIGSDIDGRVVHMLMEQFQLPAHCDAIKRYLLLGQVSFWP